MHILNTLGKILFLVSLLSTQVYAQTPIPSPTASPGPSQKPSVAPAPKQPPISIAALAHDSETATKLQIFLDQHSFSTGKIDGHWGYFGAKALERYDLAQGLQTGPQLDPAIQQDLAQISPVYIDYKLTPDDLRQVGTAPRRPAAQARVKSMPYRSILDFVAERFHSDENFIKKLNPGRNLARLKAGDSIKVPNIAPFKVETIHPEENLPTNPALASRVIKVDTRARMLDVVERDKILGSYPISPGSKQLPAPIGTWKIVRITMMPWFRWDEEMLNHGKRGSNFHNIPPGPRNPVGIAWIGLNKKGIGVHGTDNPDLIGHSASHGCIRLANWDADRVANEVTNGMTVEIF